MTTSYGISGAKYTSCGLPKTTVNTLDGLAPATYNTCLDLPWIETRGGDDVPFGEVLGLVAGALTTGGFIPQVVRVYRLKSAREISLLFTTLFLVGISFWIVYGIYFGLLSVIIWNAITAILGGLLFFAKLKYGKT